MSCSSSFLWGSRPVGRRPLIRQATFTCGWSVAIVKRPSSSSAVTRALLDGSRSRSSYSIGGRSRPAPVGNLDGRVTAGIGPDLAVEGGAFRCRRFERTSHAATVAARGKTAGAAG